MIVKTDSGEIDVDLDAHEAEVRKHFEGKGVLMRPQAEFDSEKESIRTATTAKVSSETHAAWEKGFSEVIGETRPNEVKGLDWMKTKVSDLKKPKEENPDPKVKTVDDDKRDAELASLKKKLEDKEKADTEKEALAEKKAVGTALRASIRVLPLAGDKDSERTEMRNTAETLLNNKYSWRLDEDGDPIPYDKEGNVVIDTETNQPMTVQRVVEKQMSYLLKKEEPKDKKVTGTGTGQQDVNKDPIDPKEGIKRASEEEIRVEMRARGFVAGSKEWGEFFTASMKASGLDSKK